MSDNSYKSAGVDIEAGELAVLKMKEYVHSTYNPCCLTDLGSFGGLFCPDLKGFGEPVLVSSIDGVGSKVKIAAMMDKYDTVGQDIVNHCVDDILVQGARPLFFMDYFATSRLDPSMAAEIVKGMSIAARNAKCAILGGETAEMPGVYEPGEFDIAGAIVGIADRKKIVDGSRIRPGQKLIGIASSGPHTNGYSLIRKLFFADNDFSLSDTPAILEGKTLGECLLEPHKCYLEPVSRVMEQIDVKGMAHITGGGFYSNIKRVLPKNCRAEVISGAFPVLPVFRLIRETGGIDDVEMHRAFNMGIGFILFVGPEDAGKTMEIIEASGEKAYEIGAVTPSSEPCVEVVF
ncbi:MAG: phosphoribosylformylglycinamidine cyclo-ligase [Abditibacteriota bacterium]|nr:phosphoribosylformylglycinamidine cyclo-ligase [Abditibacteriota bacterium]